MNELDMHTALEDGGTCLGVFLYHEDPDERSRLKLVLRDVGAQFIHYPAGVRPAQIRGNVVLADTTVSVWVGPMYIVGCLELPLAKLGGVRRALLFVLDEPFDINDKKDRVLLAATLPLEVLERSGT